MDSPKTVAKLKNATARIDDQRMQQVMARADFSSRLGKAIQSRQAVVTYPRRDYYRFPAAGTKWFSEIVTLARLAARRSGLAKNRPDLLKLTNNLNTILSRLDDYSATYDGFADDESRDLFIELLAYRLLGPWFVRLSIDNPGFWHLYKSVNRQYRVRKNTSRYCIWDFHTYRMPAHEGTIELNCNEISVFRTFLLEQYSVRRPEIQVRPLSGDIVLDCGACFGDTTLWFADSVGPGGRVIAFECQSVNRQKALENVGLNPALGKRITIVPRAVWRESQSGRLVTQWGSGSTVLDLTEFLKKEGIDSAREQVPAISIDDYVRDARLPTVNFIKMAIEGAELPALEGARNTLLTCRPNLAVCAFRNDIVDVYQFLDRLDIGYRFALGHFTNHSEETVLFATVSPRDAGQ
jgi:FkbM family methyltransferase